MVSEGKLKENFKLSPITNYAFAKYLLRKNLELQNKNLILLVKTLLYVW